MNEFNNENKQEEIVENQPTEPIVEEPTVEQPTEPIVEEPTVEEPTEPTVEEPTEPIVEEPKVEQPTNYYNPQKHYIPTQFNNGYQQQPPVVNQQPTPTNKKPNNHKKGLKVFIAITLAVVLFISGATVGRLTNDKNIIDKPISSQKDDDSKYQGDDLDVNSGNAVDRDDVKPDENGRYTADQVAQLVNPSVVNIQVYSTTNANVGATASGVVLNDKGYIITNDHIYSEVANAKFIINV